jgi:hypothetical protein
VILWDPLAAPTIATFYLIMVQPIRRICNEHFFRLMEVEADDSTLLCNVHGLILAAPVQGGLYNRQTHTIY